MIGKTAEPARPEESVIERILRRNPPTKDLLADLLTNTKPGEAISITLRSERKVQGRVMNVFYNGENPKEGDKPIGIQVMSKDGQRIALYEEIADYTKS